MTKEEEAIENLTKLKNKKILYGSKIGIIIEDFKVLQEDIERVLNMLKDMKVQEENYKSLIADVSGIAKELGLEEDGTIDEIYEKIKEKDKEIEKKDKIIDLMAEHINYLSDELVQATGRNELEFCNGNKCCIDSNYSCEQCIKQYFKQKATNNGQERQNVVERKGEEC